MSKVYIFFADGLEEIEGLTVVDMLRRVGIDISIVSINGTLTVTGSHKIQIGADMLLSDINTEDGCMFILPGGMPGTTYLGENETVCHILKDAAAAGKYVGAICAAPSVLGNLGLLKGKMATSYPSFLTEDMGAIISTDPVVVDGNIITSRGMGTAIEFAAELIALLKDRDTAEELKASIMYEANC